MSNILISIQEVFQGLTYELCVVCDSILQHVKFSVFSKALQLNTSAAQSEHVISSLNWSNTRYMKKM